MFSELSQNEMMDTTGGAIAWIILGIICIAVSCTAGSCNGRKEAEIDYRKEQNYYY